MLKALEVSFIVSLVSTLIIVGIPTIRKQYVDKGMVIFGTFMFLGEMIYYLVFVFSLMDEPQTILTAIMYLAVPLLVSSLLAWQLEVKMEMRISLTLMVISLMFELSAQVIPVQQSLLYVHELPSKEVKKIEVNNKQGNGNIRKVNGKSVRIERVAFECSEKKDNYVDCYIFPIDDKNSKTEVKTCYFDETFSAEKNTLTTLRRKYPTLILGEYELDVDDNYNPYEVYAYREKLYTSNGKDYGIIVLNLRDGTSKKYPASEENAPAWVDFQSTYPR